MEEGVKKELASLCSRSYRGVLAKASQHSWSEKDDTPASYFNQSNTFVPITPKPEGR